MKVLGFLSALVLATAGALPSYGGLADTATYYIGVDNLATFTSGAYNGLENPNFNRLTFLLGHGNHYHGKSNYVYQGTPPDHTTRSWPNGFFLPEGARPPIELRAGDGAFAGTMRSGIAPFAEQTDLRIRGVDHLATFDSGLEQTLFNSSGGRWNTTLGNSEIFLNLHSRSTGLMISDQLGNLLFEDYQPFSLGSGNLMDFTPVFFLDETAPNGDYFARFTLSSSNPNLLNSGEFEFRFQQVSAVPEPTSMALLGTAILFGSRRVYRKHRQRRRTIR